MHRARCCALCLALLLAFGLSAQAQTPMVIFDYEPESLLMLPGGGLVYSAITTGATGDRQVTGLIALDEQGFQRWALSLPGGMQGMNNALSLLTDGSLAYLGNVPFSRHYALSVATDGAVKGHYALLPEGAIFPTLSGGAVYYSSYDGFGYPEYKTEGYQGLWRMDLSGKAERITSVGAPDARIITRMQQLAGSRYALVTDADFKASLLKLDDQDKALWRYDLRWLPAGSEFEAAQGADEGLLFAYGVFQQAGSDLYLIRLDGQGRELGRAQLEHSSLKDIRLKRLTALPQGGYSLLGTAGSPEAHAFELRLDAKGHSLSTRWYAPGVRLYADPQGSLACLQDMTGQYSANAHIAYSSPPWCLLRARDVSGPALADIELKGLP